LLRASWFSLDGNGLTVDNKEELFTLKFTALEDIENILDLVSLNNKTIQTEAHNENLEQLDVVLNVSETPLSSIDVNSSFALGQNTPNPFTSVTQIEFTLPRSMPAQLVFTNVLGETVKVISQHFNEGENSITLNLTADEISITKSLISLK